MRLNTRPARPEDLETIARFVRALASYERLEQTVVSTPEAFGAVLFGDNPRVFCELALMGERPIGMAIWFYNFSTFLGKHGIYLEDLFVRPDFRGRGIGRALLTRLARRCVDEGLGRLEWAVLDWNEPALRFYRSLGALGLKEWIPHRVTGEALVALAGR